MADFAQLKVGQIKQAVLKKDPSFAIDEVVGKKAWVELAQQMGLKPEDVEVFNESLNETFGQMLQEAEIEEEQLEPIKVNEVDKKDPDLIPKYTTVGWHDYVMSQFHESELDRGYPKVEGMRRLAELLLGEIVFSGAVDYKSTMPEGAEPGRSVVNYEIQICWKQGVELYVDLSKFEYPVKIFRGLASCHPGNVKGSEFLVFPESIAETRAEARALRKALGLKVIAAEEFGDIKDTSITSDKIQSQQIFYINNKATTHNLNLKDILNGFGLDSIEDADRSTGADIIKRINELIKEKED